MVLPLLLAGAGYGMQAYGANQRTQAEKNAQTAYQQWLDRFNGVGQAEDSQMSDLMGSLGQQYSGDQQQLAGEFNPTDRVNSYDQGMNQSRAGIQQALALMTSMQPHQMLPQGGEPGVFAQTAGREQGVNDAAAGRLTDVTAQGAGLSAMANRDAENVFQFADQAHGIQSKITQAQRLYQLGQALRNRSLTRAAGMHQQDLANAQLAGNGWMFAGGLAGALGQGLGSYQANQPGAGSSNTFDPGAGASDLGGGSGSGAASYDPSFTGSRQA